MELAVAAKGGTRTVSMKSGLEGRNNEKTLRTSVEKALRSQ